MVEKTYELQNFEEQGKWLQKNYERLRKKYYNQFVAIKDKEVFVSGANIKQVIKKVESKGEDPSFILIEYLPKEKFNLVV